ncbi:DUF3231 family protein [Heyndrickxia sporothermodurans]
MEIIKLNKSNVNEKLTSAEIGKLWATYMGNSMSSCILTYFLQHVDEPDIQKLLENGLSLSKNFIREIESIFKQEKIPIPIGFTNEDVNLGAPRLYEDQFYVHYLKYAAKAGLSIYSIAIPLIYREDIREFFSNCINSTLVFVEQIKNVLMNKGFIIKPPQIPIPDKVEFITNNFFKGYIGNVRPLHGLEITHLYDNIENNITSKALLLGFSQVVKTEKIRSLFIKGKDFTHQHIDKYIHTLNKENLPTPSFLDHLVTTSTFPPFSDKLMLYHKVDMFSLKIRAVGNSLAVNGRFDLGGMYLKSLTNISWFVHEGAKIMIENGWFEKPPSAIDRDKIVSKK